MACSTHRGPRTSPPTIPQTDFPPAKISSSSSGSDRAAEFSPSPCHTALWRFGLGVLCEVLVFSRSSGPPLPSPTSRTCLPPTPAFPLPSRQSLCQRSSRGSFLKLLVPGLYRLQPKRCLIPGEGRNGLNTRVGCTAAGCSPVTGGLEGGGV